MTEGPGSGPRGPVPAIIVFGIGGDLWLLAYAWLVDRYTPQPGAGFFDFSRRASSAFFVDFRPARSTLESRPIWHYSHTGVLHWVGLELHGVAHGRGVDGHVDSLVELGVRP